VDLTHEFAAHKNGTENPVPFFLIMCLIFAIDKYLNSLTYAIMIALC